MKVCATCGVGFVAREGWKRVCPTCYRNAKQTELEAARRAADYWRERALGGDARLPEMKEMLPRLIRLCHPDRHGNSEASNAATQFLLTLRDKTK